MKLGAFALAPAHHSSLLLLTLIELLEIIKLALQVGAEGFDLGDLLEPLAYLLRANHGRHIDCHTLPPLRCRLLLDYALLILLGLFSVPDVKQVFTSSQWSIRHLKILGEELGAGSLSAASTICPAATIDPLTNSWRLRAASLLVSADGLCCDARLRWQQGMQFGELVE